MLDRRAQVCSPPTAHNVHLHAPKQSLYYNGHDIIRDCFMNSSSFFSGDGFASGPRAYAGVAQIRVRNILDAEKT